MTLRQPLRSIKSTPILFAIAAVCFLPGSRAAADDAEYRTKLAAAVRASAERVLPSVVTIEIVGAAGAPGGEVEQDAPTSGIVLDTDGYVLASSIVVRRPSASILVVLPDRSRHPAKVIARDNHRDLVLLKIKTEKELTAVELPDKLDLRVGQTTIAVGRYGNDVAPLVSSGVLSATDRLDGIALQTDARVGPSLYGGPLIDLKGNVLGVLVPAVAPGGAPDATSWYDSGIAFAIPTNIIKRKLARLRDGKDIDKGVIGVVAKVKDPFAASTELGAVRARSPAETVGLKAGDKVIAVAGQPVRRFQEIRQVLGSYDAGETIKIEYERDGDRQEVEVELAKTIPPLQPQRLGVLTREEPTGEDDKVEVVIDAIVPSSVVDGKLQVDDVILRVAGAQISDVDSLRRQMISAQPETAIKITIRRGDEEQELSITPTSIAGKAARRCTGSLGSAERTGMGSVAAETPRRWQCRRLPSAASRCRRRSTWSAAAVIEPRARQPRRNPEILVPDRSPSWRGRLRRGTANQRALAAEGNRRCRPDRWSRFETGAH